MRKLIGVLVVAVVIVAVAVYGFWRSNHDVVPADLDSTEPAANDDSKPNPSTARAPENPPARAAERAKRDELRSRIIAARRTRPRAAPPPAADAVQEPRSPTAPAFGNEPEPTAPGLRDRTGNHGYLMKVMNEDLMPLADECVAMARERRPDLSGMLIIDLELIGDEEIGGVVETVGPGANNEVADSELLECVTESILSATLPPPPEGGRDALSLSMPVADDE